MFGGTQNQSNVAARRTALTALGGTVSTKIGHDPAIDTVPQQVSLKQAGRTLGPDSSLAWVTGLLAVAACFAPWFARGWLVFGLVIATVALLTGYDALALWGSREENAPVLLLPERGLRGRVGQTIQIPLAITGKSGATPLGEVRVAIMATTPESENAFQSGNSTQLLKLEQPTSNQTRTTTAPTTPHVMLWPWTPEITLLRRGVWPAPRVGTEGQSRLRLWRLRRWFDPAVPLRIEADIRPGRKQILRSPIYRSLVTSRQSMWVGHGRDFERLREYQSGDNYSEIAWKSTARRSAPVTRLFQWEQKQEVYFVVDQSRASAMAIDSMIQTDGHTPAAGPSRRLLDLSIETALVGATVALELGDEFGLVTYADEPKSWLRAGSGQSHFNRFRDTLLNTEPSATTADYESLFSEIRVRLRRRAYLVLLADLTERSISDSLRRGLGLVRSSHAILVTSILPTHARPAFSPDEELGSDDDVYAALSGEKENQRLRALARQMQHLNVQLQFVPEKLFLRAAVEGYLKSKREQRL